MDSIENIKDTDALSPEEEAGMAALVKEALADTCPDPAGRIAAAVMAQIRGEMEAEEKARRAEKANERRRQRGLFMKWGGIAACMMILCGVLVVAAPLMNRTDTIAADYEAAQAETVPELLTADTVTDAAPTEAYSDEDTVTYTYTGVNEATEEAVLTKSAPVKQSNTAVDPADNAASDAEEAPAERTMLFSVRTTAADAAYDPAAENQMYLDSLLASGELAEDVYQAWMTENGYDEVTDWTIEELNAAFGFAE
jgi:hypothetical protein